MDYAGAIAVSMILVFLLGVASIIVGQIIYQQTSTRRIERIGNRVSWIGGTVFMGLAFIGWFVAIWLGFAQGAAG